MNAFENFHLRQRLEQFGVEATGHVATLMLATFLVSAWIVTSPIFYLSDRLIEACKWKEKKSAVKGIIL